MLVETLTLPVVPVVLAVEVAVGEAQVLAPQVRDLVAGLVAVTKTAAAAVALELSDRTHQQTQAAMAERACPVPSPDQQLVVLVEAVAAFTTQPTLAQRVLAVAVQAEGTARLPAGTEPLPQAAVAGAREAPQLVRQPRK